MSTVRLTLAEASRVPSAVATSSAILAPSAWTKCESIPLFSIEARSHKLSSAVSLRADAATFVGMSRPGLAPCSSCMAAVLHTSIATGLGQGGPAGGDGVLAAGAGARAVPSAPKSDVSAPSPFDDFGAGRAAGECGGVSDGTGAARATAALVAGEPSAAEDAVGACGRAGLRSMNPGGGPATGAARAPADDCAACGGGGDGLTGAESDCGVGVGRGTTEVACTAVAGGRCPDGGLVAGRGGEACAAAGCCCAADFTHSRILPSSS